MTIKSKKIATPKAVVFDAAKAAKAKVAAEVAEAKAAEVAEVKAAEVAEVKAAEVAEVKAAEVCVPLKDADIDDIRFVMLVGDESLVTAVNAAEEADAKKRQSGKTLFQMLKTDAVEPLHFKTTKKVLKADNLSSASGKIIAKKLRKLLSDGAKVKELRSSFTPESVFNFACSVGKLEKQDWILDLATELGKNPDEVVAVLCHGRKTVTEDTSDLGRTVSVTRFINLMQRDFVKVMMR